MPNKSNRIHIGNALSTKGLSRMIKDLDPQKVPARYIEKIILTMPDEQVIELSGEDLTDPIPVEGSIQWNSIKDKFKGVKNIKIIIDVLALEHDIDLLKKEIYQHRFQ